MSLVEIDKNVNEEPEVILVIVENVAHSEEDIKDFDMERECSVYVQVPVFNLVVNYDKKDFDAVQVSIKEALLAFSKELNEQIERL